MEKLLDSVKKSSDTFIDEATHTLNHTDITQLEQALEGVTPDSILDKISNFLSNPTNFLKDDQTIPSISGGIGTILDKLSSMRSRAKLIEEAFSEPEMIESKNFIYLTEKDYQKVDYYAIENPNILKMTIPTEENKRVIPLAEEDKQVIPNQSTSGGGYYKKKTLKKFK